LSVNSRKINNKTKNRITHREPAVSAGFFLFGMQRHRTVVREVIPARTETVQLYGYPYSRRKQGRKRGGLHREGKGLDPGTEGGKMDFPGRKTGSFAQNHRSSRVERRDSGAEHRKKTGCFTNWHSSCDLKR
jgi:hypothetical protein